MKRSTIRPISIRRSSSCSTTMECPFPPNIGGLSHYLAQVLRGSREATSHMKAQIKKNISKVPLIGEGMVAGMQHARDSLKQRRVIDGVLFEELGFKYFGPIDGHDLQEVCETLELAKQTEGPVLLHVMTQKGKGYSKAELNPNAYSTASVRSIWRQDSFFPRV